MIAKLRAYGITVGMAVVIAACGGTPDSAMLQAKLGSPGESPVDSRSKIVSPTRTEIDLLWKRAQSEYYAANYANALIDLDKLTSFEPNHVEYLTLKGGTETCLGKYHEAVTDYSKVVDATPSAAAYTDRAFAWNCLGEYNKGLADCDKAINIDEKYGRAYQTRGWCFNGLKKFQSALESINKAIALNYRDAAVYNNRGWAYKDLGRYEEAIADFTTALSKNKDYAQAFYGRALTYDKLRKVELASKDRAAMKRLGFAEPSAR
jgi:tetratricopeptide (TPR) repeat protein